MAAVKTGVHMEWFAWQSLGDLESNESDPNTK
jgi:hypothetical protein